MKVDAEDDFARLLIRDGVDAPRRPWCARVELLKPTEGGVRVEG
jgi:hypothetical protein